MKRIIPYITILFLCSFTLLLWVSAKKNPQEITEQPLRSLSQILALFGIILMAISTILSARIRFVDKILSGLDKAYIIHRVTGSFACIFLLNHPVLLAVQSLPQTTIAYSYFFPSADIAYTFGVLAIYSMILSFLFIVFIKLPYHLWKLSHKFLGLAFFLASTHVLLINSDVSRFFPLRVWIVMFIIGGAFATFYSLFLYRKFGRNYRYQVERIERSIDLITVYLKPAAKRIIQFSPGQFVYVVFRGKGISNEMHPFSIASAPDDQTVQISAKIVGDYTLTLAQTLRVGARSILYGPYGQFIEKPTMKKSLWIAGGIGVTPFLSMLSNEMHKAHTDRTINFYYTYSRKEEAFFLPYISELSQQIPTVHFHDWCSQEKKRLSVDMIKNSVDLRSLDAIFLCGPLPMMEGLTKQFIRAGVPEEKINFENFSFL